MIAKKGKNITIEDWLGKISLKKLLAAEYHLGSYNLILSSSEKKGHITPIMNIQGGDPTLKIKAKLRKTPEGSMKQKEKTRKTPEGSMKQKEKLRKTPEGSMYLFMK